MDLGNPVETIVHYLLIRGMTYFNHHDKFSMVSTLVCMIIHWIGLTVNYDVRLLYCHDSPNFYIACTLNLESILSLY